MKIVAYLRSNNSRTNERVTHFGEALGARFSTRERPETCDLAIQAGFQLSPALQDAMDRGVPFIILENPVWHNGDKPAMYTWGYNGLNGVSLGGNPALRPDNPHPELQPWRDPDSGDAVIFGQVENDRALRGVDIYEWAEDMLDFYPDAELREHPVMLDAPEMANQESFRDCLARVSRAITFSSTVGAESVIAGVPTIACCRGSWAWPVSTRPLEPFRTFEREEWIKELAARHWDTSGRVGVEYVLSGYQKAKEAAQRGEYDYLGPLPSHST